MPDTAILVVSSHKLDFEVLGARPGAPYQNDLSLRHRVVVAHPVDAVSCLERIRKEVGKTYVLWHKNDNASETKDALEAIQQSIRVDLFSHDPNDRFWSGLRSEMGSGPYGAMVAALVRSNQKDASEHCEAVVWMMEDHEGQSIRLAEDLLWVLQEALWLAEGSEEYPPGFAPHGTLRPAALDSTLASKLDTSPAALLEQLAFIADEHETRPVRECVNVTVSAAYALTKPASNSHDARQALLEQTTRLRDLLFGADDGHLARSQDGLLEILLSKRAEVRRR